jgi:hypothetical protein
MIDRRKINLRFLRRIFFACVVIGKCRLENLARFLLQLEVWWRYLIRFRCTTSKASVFELIIKVLLPAMNFSERWQLASLPSVLCHRHIIFLTDLPSIERNLREGPSAHWERPSDIVLKKCSGPKMPVISYHSFAILTRAICLFTIRIQNTSHKEMLCIFFRLRFCFFRNFLRYMAISEVSKQDEIWYCDSNNRHELNMFVRLQRLRWHTPDCSARSARSCTRRETTIIPTKEISTRFVHLESTRIK